MIDLLTHPRTNCCLLIRSAQVSSLLCFSVHLNLFSLQTVEVDNIMSINEILSESGGYILGDSISMKKQVEHLKAKFKVLQSFQESMREIILASILKETDIQDAVQDILSDKSLEEISGLTVSSIQSHLERTNFVEKLSEKIFCGICKISGLMKRAELEITRERHENTKFICDADPAVQCAYFGEQDAFVQGLDAIIGHPDVHVLRAIIREHQDSTRFLTVNYQLWTSPLIEIASLLGERGCFQFLLESALQQEKGGEKSNNISTFPSSEEILALQTKFDALTIVRANWIKKYGSFPGELNSKLIRTLVNFSILFSCDGLDAASGEQIAESIIARLHERDWSDWLSADLSSQLKEELSFLQLRFVEKKEDNYLSFQAILHIPRSQYAENFKDRFPEAISRATNAQNLRIQTFDEQGWNFTSDGTDEFSTIGRRLKTVQELMAISEVVSADLRVEECVAAYLYTGPMYQVFCKNILRLSLKY